jgi:hypothetical protein
MLNNGLISRTSTLEEAISWASSNLADRDYASIYTSEETRYDENGNPEIVDVPDGSLVTIHWTGDLVEREDESGKKWCFKMALVSNGSTFKNYEKCVNLVRNSLTGKLLSENPI